MTPFLLKYLCEPITKNPLQLINSVEDEFGNIISGILKSESGGEYPIINGIPRFITNLNNNTVKSFGDEWNYFNFTDFKINWLNHTVVNTFGSTDVFKNKIIVDAGGGSGSQSKWFLEYGAKHVILMELSHSVDHIIKENLKGFLNVDVIQCSIDSPPLRNNCINGIVYCHNVIQHTPDVDKTAEALFDLVDNNGEFVFNCYQLNDKGVFRKIRYYIIYKPLRFVLSQLPFSYILFYSRVMAILSLIPILGVILEKCGFCSRGDVPFMSNETKLKYYIRSFKNTCLNTFDCFGSHKYQHLKTDAEIINLIKRLQPNSTKVLNFQKYFMRPTPIGCAIRIFK